MGSLGRALSEEVSLIAQTASWPKVFAAIQVARGEGRVRRDSGTLWELGTDRTSSDGGWSRGKSSWVTTHRDTHRVFLLSTPLDCSAFKTLGLPLTLMCGATNSVGHMSRAALMSQ